MMATGFLTAQYLYLWSQQADGKDLIAPVAAPEVSAARALASCILSATKQAVSDATP